MTCLRRVLQRRCGSEETNTSRTHHCVETVIYPSGCPRDMGLVNDDGGPLSDLPWQMIGHLVVTPAFGAECGCGQAFVVCGVSEERLSCHVRYRLHENNVSRSVVLEA